MICADCVSLLDKNTNIIKKIEALLVVSGEVGLEVNTEKSKYMVVSCRQNTGKKS